MHDGPQIDRRQIDRRPEPVPQPADDVHVDDVRHWVSFEDPDELRTWVFDATFLRSNYRCIFGAGCRGVLDADATELGQGCCSYGAHFVDEDDVANVVRAFVRLEPRQMQNYDEARARGFLAPAEGDADSADDGDSAGGRGNRDGAGDAMTVTRLVEDVCIFHNRPDFAGGGGCALHLAALEAGERPLDWKPNVCWQVPLRLEHSTDENGHVTSRLRDWKRRDWGDGGADFHWWCTESSEAYVGDEPVYLSARDEIVELVGAPIYARLVTALEAAETPVAMRPRR